MKREGRDQTILRAMQNAHLCAKEVATGMQSEQECDLSQVIQRSFVVAGNNL